MLGDGMEDDYLYDGRASKSQIKRINTQKGNPMEEGLNEFITNCEHCKGLGCDYCEDRTLPHHNKAKIQEALDFCKGDRETNSYIGWDIGG